MKVFTVVLTSALVLVLAVILGFRFLRSQVPYPAVSNKWWGADQPESGKGDDIIIQKMEPIHFPEEDLEDLSRRLAQTRYFQSLEGTRWEYGSSVADLKQIVKYWREEFNWRKQEDLINSFQHYTAKIDGIKVHYVHVKPETKAAKVIPIVLIHGWPGSFYEFHKVIPLLTNPRNSNSDFSFEVICPSLPGYTFSEAPHKPGLHPIEMANMFTKLMAALGFKSYYVQGGDWGSLVARTMAILDASHIKGLHINFFTPSPPYGPLSLLSASLFPSWTYDSQTEIDKARAVPMKELFFMFLRETGYFHIQATKPESLGVALNDSPVGLAAYIIEKFFAWSGCKRNDTFTCLESLFTKDELLTNVMLYWLTGSITSSMRIYKENPLGRGYPVSVPTALARFPDELTATVTPLAWLRIPYPNIIQHTEMPRGGHFGALQEPQLFASDIWKFVTKVELAPSDA